jgi:heterodisulfide reductase subunit A
MRKAIYIPFPQAVPNKYLIDAESCTYVQKGKCGVCAKICPAQCIDLDEKDQEVEITVGNIVVATGFQVFDASRAEQFGYGKFPNVVTSLEFERLVNAAGPTGGSITERTKDKRGNWIFSPDSESPKSIALIHCVGSRDENYNRYCSRVCCMYSLKLAHLVKEKLPDAEVSEYYIDMRAFGKGYEEFYERIKSEGIHIIRGRTAKIEEQNGQLLLRSEDMEKDELIEQVFDMAILAVGLEPRPETAGLADMLGLSRGDDGWFTEANYNSEPVTTFKGGITIAGVCQGPKDIPDSVAQGSAAASRVLQSIVKGKISQSISELPLASIEARAKELSTLQGGE